MIREFRKKIERFITEKIPDPAKILFFYSLSFYVGYMVGEFGYHNTDVIMQKICDVYYPQ